MHGRINRCSHCGCDEPILGIDGKRYCDNCGMSLEKLERGLTQNKIEEVAALFGKKLGEEFRLKAGCGNIELVRFCEKGVEYYSVCLCRWKPSERILILLLTGEVEIVEDEGNEQ